MHQILSRKELMPPCPFCHRMKYVSFNGDWKINGEIGCKYVCSNRDCRSEFWMAYLVIPDADVIIEQTRKRVEGFNLK